VRSILLRASVVLALVAIGASTALSITPASAQPEQSSGGVILLTVDDATLEDLLSTSGFANLAAEGGAALLVQNGSGDVLTDLSDAAAVSPEQLIGQAYRFGSVAGSDGLPSQEKLDAAADQLHSLLASSEADHVIAMVVATSPPAAEEHSGNASGAAIVAQGAPSELADVMSGATPAPAPSLTSDSTRRSGVITSADLVETGLAVAGLGDDAFHDGARVRFEDAPAPTDLYDRYVQSKRLTVPIGVAAAVYVGLASLIAIIALWRPDVSPGHRRFCASLAISVPFVALSLLLVGHLPSLTYATVIPFVVATTALATLALSPAARRWGTLGAIATAGIILLGTLVVEGALGWPAALTPLLGGSQLDGGRFFGLPNAFIGLLLGGSLYVAQRLPRTSGTAVIAAAGLFAGAPWTGSNFGAAVTLFATAGIWWGLRGELVWWRTAVAAAAATAAGTILVVAAHRYLTSAATHITTFSEHTGGIAGIWSTFVDRLGVGFDLIADNPFALLPVVGVLVMLGVILRPPAAIRRSFDAAPVWRLALLTIVVGSVVAYLANDSGAAAVGEGLTTSLAGMLYVSLRLRDGMMTT
jgi:hypothetical protein